MIKAKNYDVLRRGITAAVIVAAGARVLTACEDAPNPTIQPPLVRVEIAKGEEMSSSGILLHGCFQEKGKAFYDNAGPVGTLALEQSVNDMPITFKFTALGTHDEEILGLSEVNKLSTYTPGQGEWYSSPAGQGQTEDAHCIQRLQPGNLLPAQYDGRFAQVRYRDEGPYELYGPYDKTSYIDSACGPVTVINETIFGMRDISLPNEGVNSELLPVPEDCRR